MSTPGAGASSPRAGHTLRWWWACLAQSVRRDLQFRSQVVTTAVTALTDLALSLVPVLLLVRTTHGAAGWTGALAVAVVGAHGIAASMIDTFVAPNLVRMESYVREGDLDLVLIRPVSAPLFTALRWTRPAELTGALTGTALLTGGLLAAHARVTASGLLALIGWLAVGVVAFVLFWANLSYVTFWTAGADPVNEIAGGLRSAGQYPRTWFGRGARAVFSTVVPATLIGSVPVEALLGDVGWKWLLLAGVAIAVVAVLTGLHWRIGVRRYESASS